MGLTLFAKFILIASFYNAVLIKSLWAFENDRTILNDEFKIRGRILKTSQNHDYYAFLGIPYAKPPIEAKRFKDPEPYGQWNDILDATEDGNICPQYIKGNNTTGFENMSEDCLYLNVYTRSMQANCSVLIFIHGGGYRTGSGNYKYHQPKYLLDEDIVLVTFNHRLDALGFISTGTLDAIGNFGLKDQVLVLKWVQNNIHNFGGNPNSVTLIGYSAGAMAVTLHMTSPMSQNLFHKAIVMSGSATAHINIDNQNLTRTLAKMLNCSSEHAAADMIECMRNKPWQEIIDKSAILSNSYNLIKLTWNFEIERDFGQDRFIINHPSIMFKNGEFNKVPIITGTTKDEFSKVAHAVVMYDEIKNKINDEFRQFAPDYFDYNHLNTNKTDEISDRIREFYFKKQNIGILTESELGQLFSDGLINHGVHRLVQLASKYVNVYHYRIDFKGGYTCGYYNSNGEPLYVGHSDDLMYLFVYPRCAREFTINDPELIMIKRYVKFFTNFAKYGDPNLGLENNNDVKCTSKWEPINNEKLRTFYIGDICQMKDSSFQDRLAVWDELFPIDV